MKLPTPAPAYRQAGIPPKRDGARSGQQGGAREGGVTGCQKVG